MTDQERKVMEMALDALENTARSAVEQYVIEQHAVEALRQALEQPEQEPFEMEWPDYNESAMGCGLEDRNITDRYEAMQYGWDEAISRVSECLPDVLYTAPPSKPEPVAWVKEGMVRVGFGRIEERKYVQFDQTLPVGTKLYAAPPSKPWVSLSDEQIEGIAKCYALNNPATPLHFARAIEAASKELNT